MKERIISYIGQCHNPDEGGFRGAPYIKSHVASTYAAVMTIVNVAQEEGYELIDIPAMKRYLSSVKNNYKYADDSTNIFGFMKGEELEKAD